MRCGGEVIHCHHNGATTVCRLSKEPLWIGAQFLVARQIPHLTPIARIEPVLEMNHFLTQAVLRIERNDAEPGKTKRLGT